MLSEFLRSLGVGLGIPIAVFFLFRLRKGSYSSDYSSKSFDTDRIVIDKPVSYTHLTLPTKA